jgi:hypothetical protein
MKWIKQHWAIILIAGATFLLDWAALDDITTGNEPNYYGEYVILALSVLVFVALAVMYRRKNKAK